MRRLVRETKGQDLVEYALLAGFVALASAAALPLIEGALQTTYVSWGANTEALSCMPDPGGGGCP
jgi:Flp pilus assembly pilin Flp